MHLPTRRIESNRFADRNNNLHCPRNDRQLLRRRYRRHYGAAEPIVNAGPDDTVCVNTPYVLQGSLLAGQTPITYTWTPSTGLSSSSVLTPTATISAQRTYCLSARDSAAASRIQIV
jgi:hypothetical protein